MQVTVGVHDTRRDPGVYLTGYVFSP